MVLSESVPSSWSAHVLRAGPHRLDSDSDPAPEEHRKHVKPWLSALFQAEHLNLLVGNGFTTAISLAAGVSSVDMADVNLQGKFAKSVQERARESARLIGRSAPNIEDQIRAINELIAGLRILSIDVPLDWHSTLPTDTVVPKGLVTDWKKELDALLRSFIRAVLQTEHQIFSVLSDGGDLERANRVRRLLGGFLLPFTSRAATRDRLHIFTTNYDRLMEYSCDLLGLHIVDRFVGALAPVFQASRLGLDLHYNPPGIRGEPRYLEGVVRLSKLHGSLDWRYRWGPSGTMEVQRCALPFGAMGDHPELSGNVGESVLIYPNPAKDVETLEYPYAELFRDFAAATCRPNAVVVTYGYGFGDDHLNRTLADMLTISSTHLVIISYDGAGGRLQRFCERVGRDEQITLLIGSHFGDLETLVRYYLPKPAIDRTTFKMVDLLERRLRPNSQDMKRSNPQSMEVAD